MIVVQVLGLELFNDSAKLIKKGEIYYTRHRNQRLFDPVKGCQERVGPRN